MNPGHTPAIEFRNVSISFDDLQALKNISFTLPRGEMLCVTGDSGSGKSVLLRLALGFLRPDEGQILINGRETTAMEEDALLALRREAMGMVFQENSFFSGQTVYENTAYRLDDRDWPEDEIERAVVEVLTFVGLQDEQEKQAEDLSGGMKRRLELARALIGWPSIMLYDEPTAGLDPINARQVLDLIIRARDLHHTSSMLVTKALHEIPYLARHRAREGPQGGYVELGGGYVPGVQVCLLEEGRIAFFGSPQEFAQSSLPAVQHMLHPMTEAAHGKLDVDDPWRQNQRTRPSVDMTTTAT
jgi:phospholipid/cholesterol/gamma-HCH transport system ATP-binding protein